MTCPKCGKEHDGKFKHCRYCLDKLRKHHITYREKHKKNKPTNCIICGKTIEQSRMGRPKIYCNACAYQKILIRHGGRMQPVKNNFESAALRLDDAAKYLSVSKATLRGLLQAGKIESFVVNKRGDRRIAIKALDKFMKDNASKGLGESPLKANEARRQHGKNN